MRAPPSSIRRHLVLSHSSRIHPGHLSGASPKSYNLPLSWHIWLFHCELADVTLPKGSSLASLHSDFSFKPFQTLMLRRGCSRTFAPLPVCHAIVLTALQSGVDATLDQLEARRFSATSSVAVECIQVAMSCEFDRYMGMSRTLASHLRLAHLLCVQPPDASLLVTQELRACSSGFPPMVLVALLSISTSPALLRNIVQHALEKSGDSESNSPLCPTVLHALLGNDNFFSHSAFNTMHALVMDVVRRPLCWGGGGGSDSIFVRWTPLMNKLARVYAKQQKGTELHDCFDVLLAIAPSAETKIPLSFYVHLLGALLDLGASDPPPKSDTAPHDVWPRIVQVAHRAVRLFGHSPKDLRSIWVVVLKSALICWPPQDDYRRLLEAYHLCAELGHPVQVDKGALLQVIRLVSAAIHRVDGKDAVEAMQLMSVFLEEQEGLNFLWMLDGVGRILSELWSARGLLARSAAVILLDTVQRLVQERAITGVHLQNNPVIAEALERFRIGDAAPFWWNCGCGTRLPSTSKRCVECLRHSRASWTCAHCTRQHRTHCHDQCCTCGSHNPRYEAAVRVRCLLCSTCGDVIMDGQLCARCRACESDRNQTTTCETCQSVYSSAALYCPTCFATRSEKPVQLWHCGVCQQLNYTTWSSCQTCKEHTPRRTGCFTMPFLPWVCGCGTLNHPCRLACTACSSRELWQYTCPSCKHLAPLRGLQTTNMVLGEGRRFLLHLCHHCITAHPRDGLVVYSPSLPRRCMLCGRMVKRHDVYGDGSFMHCGAYQYINEYVPFQCSKCDDRTPQQGFQCRSCHFPRPEVGGNLTDQLPFYVWRCLKEIDADGCRCGQWNYSWLSVCMQCDSGRASSPFEYRVRAQEWVCRECNHVNQPINVLLCGSCHRGVQPISECAICGAQHLLYACDAA